MPSPYWEVVERVYAEHLPRREADLLRYLIHRADFATGRCAPGFRRILKDVGMGLRTFLAARESLRSKGHITWTQRKIAGQYNDTTEYQLTPQWWVLNDTQGVGAKRHRKHTTRRRKSYVTATASPANDSGATHCAGCQKNISTDTTSIAGYCRRCWALQNTSVLPGGGE